MVFANYANFIQKKMVEEKEWFENFPNGNVYSYFRTLPHESYRISFNSHSCNISEGRLLLQSQFFIFNINKSYSFNFQIDKSKCTHSAFQRWRNCASRFSPINHNNLTSKSSVFVDLSFKEILA